MSLHSRRNFLGFVGTAAGGLSLAPSLRVDASERFSSIDSFGGLPDDEGFWLKIRSGFDLPRGVINLDNGYCNPLSRETMTDLVERVRYIQQLPGKRIEELFEKVTSAVLRPGLGSLLGVPADELAFTRNATEALDTVILGLPMKAGDEIVCCSTDYYSMLDAIEQRRDRDGIVIRMFEPAFPTSADALVGQYEKAINSKTKLVLVTHVSNLTGQIFPVKRIAEIAHRVGAEVVVDGAQTMAILDFKIPDLDCDYFGASLHKWLGAPVGSGVLWMRKQLVEKVWPTIPPPAGMKGMARFEWCGTFPEFVSSAAVPAVRFSAMLGARRKEERIRFLAGYLRSKIEKIPGIAFLSTSEDSCGLTVFHIPGVDLAKLQKDLWEKENILVQHMTGGPRLPKLSGIRVSPNVYTTPAELDRFARVLKVSLTRRTV
jgi:isopenicillin-N epimerase